MSQTHTHTQSSRWKFYILPVVLLVGHTLLVEIATWIELNDAWNDMNPTMLVAMSLYAIDYPVIKFLEQFVDRQHEAGTFLYGLKVLGGLFWFAIGMGLSAAGLAIGKLAALPRADTRQSA